ncbi:MAG: hypothetical protein HY898_10115 [Deltaproteobacteria bacterium]|nr:hypothetical protein [Deltaproteobacteria bacterium]
MTTPYGPPFRRDQFFRSEALAGARWWQDQLRAKSNPVSRRALLLTVALGAGIVAVGGVGVAIAAATSDDEEVKKEDSLTAQKAHGWDFGSELEPLPFDPSTSGSFDPSVCSTLATDLAPTQPRLQPYYVPTLFQSLSAKPTGELPPGAPRALPSVMRPVQTPEMTVAYERGRALASLMAAAPAGRALLVDLPGPEAVAFAAGLAERLEPVFLFDNWPHPRGVVASHVTLAAAVSYLPRFREAASTRSPQAPPVFVLDRNRLNPYTDDSEKFDNRCLARTPPVSGLKALGISQLLYVSSKAETQEGDDVIADLVAYSNAGVDVKTVAATDFRAEDALPTPDPVAPGARDAGAPIAKGGAVHAGPYYYGGYGHTHLAFIHAYGWGTPAAPFRTPTNVSRGFAYRPVPRATIFSPSAGATKSKPAGFGQVSTVVNRSTGRVVGVQFGRSGSYGRGSSWGG